MTLLHIAVRSEWDAAGAVYAPAAFADEGFVHCSYVHQVVATAARYYAGRTDLVLLEIDESRLTAKVVEEPSPSTGERFPHVYGPVDRAAVVAVHDFAPGAGGGFALPEGLGGDP